MGIQRAETQYISGMRRYFPLEVILEGPLDGMKREDFLQRIERLLAENFGRSHDKWWMPYDQRYPKFSICFKYDTDAVTFKLIFEQ